MTQTAVVAVFTNQLAELVAHGIPIRKSLMEMSRMQAASDKLRRLAEEIGRGLEEGRRLSAVLAATNSIVFPQWYTAFINAAEEHGGMCETLTFLTRTLQAQQKTGAAFISALLYPLIVVVACLVCSIWAAVAFPQWFANDALAYRGGMVGSFFFANLFLLAVLFLAIVVLRMVLQANPCVSLMHALDFLTQKGASLSQSLAYALPVIEKNERLCDAVLDIRERLLHGEPVAQTFAEQLSAAGFVSAAQIISVQLSLAQSGGEKNVFGKTAQVLSQKVERLRSSVLTCEQPVLLCCVAVYMLILLKNTLMPYMVGIGV